jgi:hypothetical protein
MVQRVGTSTTLYQKRIEIANFNEWTPLLKTENNGGTPPPLEKSNSVVEPHFEKFMD